MSDHAEPRQLALSLPHAESLSRDDFLEGRANRDALALIDRWPDWPHRVMLICGPQGAGKSHLASIWASDAGARVITAHAMTSAEVPTALATGALVVEDIGRDGCDERALFHLLNMAREWDAYLLLTARVAPAAQQIDLRDLRSRLRAVPVIDLLAPDDDLLRALIVKLCADRQMTVDEPLVTYLITRVDRSYAGVQRVVAELDDEALRQRRPVTRALAVDLLRRRDDP